MGRYKALKVDKLSEGSYSITPIRRKDMEQIRQWRNAQITTLRQQQPLSQEEQERYFRDVVSPQFEEDFPPQILFSFFKDEHFIGYGGLVHISWRDKRGEMSFLVDPAIAARPKIYKECMTAYIALMKQVVFKHLGFHRLSTEAYSFREYHIAILEEAGFVYEGSFRDYIFQFGNFHDAVNHSILRGEYESGIKGFNVLVTSISKKIPLLESLKSSLKKVGKSIEIYGGDSDPKCLAKECLEHFWKMPKLSALTLEKLISYCHQYHIGLIIPTRNGELAYFAKHKKALKKAGIHVMVSSEEVVEACLDKLAFSQQFPVIPSFARVEDLPSDRVVVKERFGAGSVSIGLNLTKKEAEKHAKKLQDPIFQSFVEGDEVSIDAYITAKGDIKGMILRRRDLVVAGESQVTTTFEDKRIEKQVVPLIKALKPYGHIIIQAIVDKEKRVHIIECNPRFGGASTLSVKAGLDSFFWAYLEAIGESLEGYPFSKLETPLRQTRVPYDLYS